MAARNHFAAPVRSGAEGTNQMTRRTGNYGKRYNRSGRSAPQAQLRPHQGHAAGATPPTLPHAPGHQGDIEYAFSKALYGLGYTKQTLGVVQRFQADFNSVRASGSIKTGPSKLTINNSLDKSTWAALHSAKVFQAEMPKSWGYYVNKAKDMGY